MVFVYVLNGILSVSQVRSAGTSGERLPGDSFFFCVASGDTGMRKRLLAIPLSKPIQNAEVGFPTYGLFIYGDVHY